ncbi:radical SAM family heme chaperone HemW [Methylotenera versatilis]|uniref:radical SAM family heme chaperone HemW n=1 Tax=Methylotenera versatilis TaxID=1055487 RepID=UPI0006485E65|nr:radical SAM family heme chaperone HemW [Methylotenera versatilis]
MKKVIPIKADTLFNTKTEPINSTSPLLGQATLSGLANPPPLSLYIHIPWCVKKCPYCDFNSHESRTDIPEKRYVAALIADLEQSVPRIYGRKIRSVFFGGGTPSLFSAESIDEILSTVRMLTPLEYGAEITLEANPGTVETSRFAGYKEAGINRISLGIQSFNADYLKALGRIHDDKQAITAAELALSTFERVNLDVMYALPNQTLEHALNDTRQAIALNPDHLSFYHLTLEPNTPFHRTPPSLPDDDLSADMQEQIEALLAEHGYEHYETSAFCKPNSHARHNMNYWQFGDYLGIGAGAHSKLSYHDKITRETRHKHPKAFMENAEASNAVDNSWLIPQADLGFEFMMNALRLTSGFETKLFQERTGKSIQSINLGIKTALEKKLIQQDLQRITPTLLGQRYLNDLLALFL